MKKQIMLSLLLAVTFTLRAQMIKRQVVNSVGRSYHSSPVTLHLSVGEPIVGYRQGGGLQVSQGFFTGSAKTISTAINFLQEDKAQVIYPNPTSDRIFINTQSIRPCQLEIKNTLGQIVLSALISQDGISVMELPAGLYLVNLYDAQSQLYQTLRFIKQ